MPRGRLIFPFLVDIAEVYRHGQAFFVEIGGPAGRVTLKALDHEVRLPGPVHARDAYLLDDPFTGRR